ncbi:MAG: hypothetical protein GC137_10585 [Alphaproteobacteria bacterium]|nr:hypothetical protein [Alphaproteobacteria bacterium]
METEYNMTDAAAIAGVSRRTFYNHIDSKNITTKRNRNDDKVVDLSELKRVYGDEVVLKNLQKLNDKDNVQERENAHLESVQSTENNNTALLKARIENLEKEKGLIENQVEQVREERDFLRERLKDAQEGQKRITLLLEDKSKRPEENDEWKKSLKALENRLANQEKAAKERAEEEQKLIEENKRIKQAYTKKQKELEEEKNKGFFKKLFG